MSAFRAALRIACRDALAAKGRSALVMVMIGLPVMTIVALIVLFWTSEWSPRESLPYDLGRADARLTAMSRSPVQQDVLGHATGESGAFGRPWTTPEVARQVTVVLGPHARVVAMAARDTPLRTDRGYRDVMDREIDLRDPLTKGILAITGGRAPASPGEVAVSAGLRDRGYRIGTTVRLTRADLPRQVVGYVVDQQDRWRDVVQGLPGTVPSDRPAQPAAGPPDGPQEWLVAAGHPVTWQDVRALDQYGFLVESREVVSHPSTAGRLPADLQVGETSAVPSAVVLLAVVMIVLEVVLLAGPAFAVGVRRQRRQLALIAATGGEPRHLRMIVLGGGLVLGSAAAVIGLLAGLGVAAVAVPIIENVTHSTNGPYEVVWSQVTATVVVGALSGVLAAYVPARQVARMSVVAALAGRRDQARTRRGWPIAGGVLIGCGILASILGVRVWHEYGAAIGTALIVIGVVAASPAVVGLAARAGRVLPLPLRLGARDAGRNRGRTAPAIAAIMAAVAGITALAIGGASDFEQNKVEYTPRLQMGSAMIQGSQLSPEQWADIGSAVRRELPGVPLTEWRDVSGGDPSDCASDGAGCLAVELDRNSCDAPGSQVPESCAMPYTDGLIVGGERLFRFLYGRDDPAVTAALRTGKTVVFNPADAPGGTAVFRITRQPAQGEAEPKPRTVRLPAVVVPLSNPPAQALLPEAATRRLGVPVAMNGFVVDRADHRLSQAEQGHIEEAVAGVSDQAQVYVERGFTESFAVPLLLLAAAGVVLVLGGTAIATGLAAADARPDLGTLAAVGAAPRTRRLLTMSQAAVVALLGSWLGIAAGVVPGIAVAYPLTANNGSYGTTDGVPRHGVIIAVPWGLLASVAIVVPLVAVLAAGLFTRSRLPLARRIGQ